MRTTPDPLLAELAAPAGRYTCQLDDALAHLGQAQRQAVLAAVVAGPRGPRRLASLLAAHGLAVSEGTLHRHRYSGCTVCGIEAAR